MSEDRIEESPDVHKDDAEADWDNEAFGSMADYATDDDAVNLEEEGSD